MAAVECMQKGHRDRIFEEDDLFAGMYLGCMADQILYENEMRFRPLPHRPGGLRLEQLGPYTVDEEGTVRVEV
jgi:hypothetical protein